MFPFFQVDLEDSNSVELALLENLTDEIIIPAEFHSPANININEELMRLRNDITTSDGMRLVLGDPDRVVVPPLLEPTTYYDQNLTSAHKYLGDGLQETTGRTILEEGVIHTIPVIFLKFIIIPGQILPIIAHSSSIKTILKYALARNRVFGVSCHIDGEVRTFGTIAEIFEHSVDTESDQSFKVKAMGHQRYEILSTDPFPENDFLHNDDPVQPIVLAQIKIIPDITLTNPFNKLCLHPKNRNSKHNTVRCCGKDLWQTQWPNWVYKQFDANHLASLVAEKTKILYQDAKLSDDPCVLSFQLLRLGIFNLKQSNFLLGTESTNLRLQYELQFMSDNDLMRTFICTGENCGKIVCNMSNVFPMSPEGPQGTYCNSWGQIHNMITVTELDSDIDVISMGSPSSECSWFPGYKWIIILCPVCQNHLGWRYLANNNSTMPRLFYGLRTGSISSIKNDIPAYQVQEHF